MSCRWALCWSPCLVSFGMCWPQRTLLTWSPWVCHWKSSEHAFSSGAIVRIGWVVWPFLRPLSQRRQQITHSSLNDVVIQGEDFSTVFPLERFLSPKLLRLTSLVFKFINSSRRLEVVSEGLAANFLMKTMQQQSRPEKLKFLLDAAGRTVPKLVWGFDLFIDR